MLAGYRFVEKYRIAFALSGFLALISVASIVMRDFRMGIDFVGGISAKVELAFPRAEDGSSSSRDESFQGRLDVQEMRDLFLTRFEEVVVDEEFPSENFSQNAQWFNFRVRQPSIGKEIDGFITSEEHDRLNALGLFSPDVDLSKEERALIDRLSMTREKLFPIAVNEREILQDLLLRYVVRSVLMGTIVKSFAAEDPSRVTLLSQEFYSPTLGAAMQEAAAAVSLLICALILVYVTLRFQFKFGLAAVICLAHDALLTVGMASVLDREVNVPLVIAVLTLLGYSINDTIVVFDRIRENSGSIRDRDYIDVINLSISQCMSRTIVTSVTVEMVALPLLIAAVAFNVEAFFDLALFLGIGVILGTYSSIFIASPLLFLYEKFASNMKTRKKERRKNTPPKVSVS